MNIQFSEEDKRIANRHLEVVSIIYHWEIYIKTTKRDHLTPMRMAYVNNSRNHLC